MPSRERAGWIATAPRGALTQLSQPDMQQDFRKELPLLFVRSQVQMQVNCLHWPGPAVHLRHQEKIHVHNIQELGDGSHAIHAGTIALNFAVSLQLRQCAVPRDGQVV